LSPSSAQCAHESELYGRLAKHSLSFESIEEKQSLVSDAMGTVCLEEAFDKPFEENPLLQKEWEFGGLAKDVEGLL